VLQLAAVQYDIRTETDPRRAIEAATEFHPDLILMDRFMAKMSGDCLAKTFQAHPTLHHIPIAFLTASVPCDAEGRYCTHLDGRPVLMKPVSIEQIDQCVRECVKR
jgi:CheY-like chemotaxis protein